MCKSFEVVYFLKAIAFFIKTIKINYYTAPLNVTNICHFVGTD